MYADRVAAGSKRSVKERLNGNSEENFGGSRRSNNKRQRQNEDKWEHDLYDHDGEPHISNPKVGDLRLKLQKKGSQQVYQRGRGSVAGGVQDLREKLSGSMHSQPENAKPVLEVKKPAIKSTQADVPSPETKKAASVASSRKKSQKKADTVDGLLRSLDLEKYIITFKAEEVDMTALMHMTDDDLKALGIPMGPRKKILLALDSRD
ncbi:Sterile alpha motif domain [Macleaya cordata]|uniref:Sterile alpha motif domain n=1 Tax=Macleaya cordata TaxID=56857 RepID=A0A200Q8Z6_MACCD|nr:Sterile alpha motif domain [Macleaya cordata]